MSGKTVYVALSQFCEKDNRPRQVLLEAGFTVRVNTSGRRLQSHEIVKLLPDAHAVLAGVEPYTQETLSALPRLRCISRCGIGTDSIDLAAAKARDISVFVTGDEVVEPVAQMTVGMILALARNFPVHWTDLRSGTWRKVTGHLLSEWTVGLVGFGRIGRTVERFLRPFGSRVLVTDPCLKPSDLPAGVELLDLPSLLAQSDLVSLHAARRREAGPLIGKKELALMKPGSFLINNARGHLVEELALYQAIESGHLAGAALDVFEEEPYKGPLRCLPQVICTPHVASLTQSSRAAMELRAALNIANFFAQAEFEGNLPIFAGNPEA